MRFAIISDIHGNLEALQVVMNDIAINGVQKIFCLGDTIGYGPYTNECLDMVFDRCEIVVLGNHEDAARHFFSRTGLLRDWLNSDAFESIGYARRHLTNTNIGRLENLERAIYLEDLQIGLAHGSFANRSEWEYVKEKDEYKKELEGLSGLKANICVLGHTHIPRIFSSEHEITCVGKWGYLLDSQKKHIVNVGSVGQPRDRNIEASYGLFEVDERGEIRYFPRRVPYSTDKTAEAIINASLPEYLANRLHVGC